jgi:hypothetical protein
MNPESISPELAAMIVKKYVLPMFESQERKALKSKYNKMSSISAGTGYKMNLLKAEDY